MTRGETIMARGLFSGLIWGGMTALFIMVVASLYAPLPGPQTQNVDLVAGTEFGRPVGDRAVAPLPVDPPSTVNASAPVVLDPIQPDVAPAPDVTAAPAPVPDAVLPEPEPPADPDPATALDRDTDVIVLPQASAPVLAPPAPEVADPFRDGPDQPRPLRPDQGLADATPTLPDVTPDPVDPGQPDPLPQLAMNMPAAPAMPQVTDPSPAMVQPRVSNRLPTIGQTDLPDDTPAATAPLGALERNARDFRNLLAQPLFSVVLMSDGTTDLSGQLGLLPLPVAIVLPVDAADQAPAYAQAGVEVLIFDDQMVSAGPDDAMRVRLAQVTAMMPEAVGLFLPVDAPVMKDRAALDALFAALSETGHGAVALPQGLDVFAERAALAGIPAQPMFRRLDANDEDAPVIRRYLDRASFEAAQNGRVIMLGQARAETLAALREWAGSRRAKGVALAPVSAVLIAAAGGA